ncbi:MAG: helix-turn-helix domain-containing protein [Oscillospiraceae bacterium]|nr:helix-turn-helix domain-containing protein [Oscillospiraceae bacterium]
MNNFSRVITLLRKERGITQKQAAMDLGISQALLSHYEKGLRECGLDFLVRLCDYYNVSSDYILGRSADRFGAVLSVDDLPADSSTKDSKFTGSVLPTMNKRLIFSSLNILYDKLAQSGNKELTTKVSDYISLSIYKVFRIIYSSNKANSQSLFKVKFNSFEGYTSAAEFKTCAQINEIVKDKQNAKNNTFEMTSESITKEYPQHSTGFFNVIKSAEDVILK